MPIENRIEMPASGMKTAVGVRVTGRNPDEVVAAFEAIAPEL